MREEDNCEERVEIENEGRVRRELWDKPGEGAGGVRGSPNKTGTVHESTHLELILTKQHKLEKRTFLYQPVPYLPIIVECCWTAASSSLSRMVHSPMVMDRCQRCHRKQDSRLSSGPQDQPMTS